MSPLYNILGCSQKMFSRFKSKIIDNIYLAFVSVTNTRMIHMKMFDPIVPGLHALAQMKREPLSPGFTVEIDLLY